MPEIQEAIAVHFFGKSCTLLDWVRATFRELHVIDDDHIAHYEHKDMFSWSQKQDRAFFSSSASP